MSRPRTWIASAAQQAADGVADRVSQLSFTAGEVAVALAILLLSWALARVARRGVARATAKVPGVSDDLRSLAVRMSGYLVLFIGLGVALSVLGAQIQPFLATAIIIGVVLALALRGIADNFAAGIVIQSRRPVHIGDAIDALGFAGFVRELNSRSVVIETADGRTVHLPNHKLLEGPIVNDTVAGRRRSEVEVRTREADGGAISELLAAVTGGAEGVLSDPPPTVLVVSREPEWATFLVRFWHLPSTGAQVTSNVVDLIAPVGASTTVRPGRGGPDRPGPCP